MKNLSNTHTLQIKSRALRLFVLEDDTDLLASVVDYLTLAGHSVDCSSDGKSGLNLILQNRYDAIVLDINLPTMDGLHVCSAVRESVKQATPIIMLTAKDTEAERIEGFEHGADDYLVKPFSLRELEMRLQAITRRAVLNQGASLRVSDLVYNLRQERVQRGDNEIILPPLCKKLLALLMQRSPHIVSRADLEFALWGENPPDGDSLKIHIHWLRKAVDQPFSSNLIKTVHGSGYKISA